MMALDEHGRHDEVWRLLPWLASGRLPATEREMVEEHIRHCGACEQELALQHRLCDAFTQPDTVVYAPGPSFRKLMDRIDSESNGEIRTRARGRKPALLGRLGHVSLWRPPGLAWAASFVLLFGITGLVMTSYRGSESALYRTHTDPSVVTPNVLHIALDRSVPIGEVEELLQAGGARIVEGPGNTGILGVTPVGVIDGQTSAASANKQLRALSSRLRADPRVLWVQPLAPDAQEH